MSDLVYSRDTFRHHLQRDVRHISRANQKAWRLYQDALTQEDGNAAARFFVRHLVYSAVLNGFTEILHRYAPIEAEAA